jgi:hypothetical protein
MATSLLAVVAWGSAARGIGAGRLPSWATLLLVCLVIAFGVAMAIVGCVLMGFSVPALIGWRTMVAILGLTSAVVVVSFVLSSSKSHQLNRCGRGEFGQAFCQKGTGSHSAEAAKRNQVPKSGPSALVVLAAGFGAVVIAGVAVGLLVLQRRRGERGEPAPEAPLVIAVDESLDSLRSDEDVRRAIIACYAHMERAFAGAGVGRFAAEAPLEYLRRVLGSIAPAAGQLLTSLFERAAFSVEPMGEQEKYRAIAALEALRLAVSA